MIIKDRTGNPTEFKLPEAFKDKWLKALRSGKFQQGVCRLHDKETNKYCCLGVACRITHPRKDLLDVSVISIDSKDIKVPNFLKGDINENNKNYSPIVKILTHLNDIDEKNFNQIADWIEENL